MSTGVYDRKPHVAQTESAHLSPEQRNGATMPDPTAPPRRQQRRHVRAAPVWEVVSVEAWETFVGWATTREHPLQPVIEALLAGQIVRLAVDDSTRKPTIESLRKLAQSRGRKLQAKTNADALIVRALPVDEDVQA